jgi:hypothetical protein
MRRLWIIFVLILVSASAATGVRLHALTECERWIAEYRDALSHSPTVQRANAARHRVNHYVRRKVATFNKPRPRVLPVRYQLPKMGREEALRKMEFACGNIDLDDPVLSKIAAGPSPMFVPAASEEGSEPLAPPSNLVAQNTPPSTGGGGFPIGGVPTAPLFPGGGGGGSVPGGGGGGTEPGNPAPPPPVTPPAQTPEPGSLVLMATGLVGAAGMVRRRLTSRG